MSVVRIPVIRREASLPSGGGLPLMDTRRAGAAGAVVAEGGRALMATAADMQQEVERQAREDKIRQAEIDRVEHEQAKARVDEAASSARLQWTQHYIDRQSAAEPGAPNFTGSFLTEFDKYRDQAAAGVTDERERAMLRARLDDIREGLALQSMQYEAGARRAYRSDVLATGIDTDAKTVALDPTQFPSVLAARLVAIQGSTDLSPADRAKLAEQARESLGLQAALTLADRDPDAFLARAGQAGKKTGKDGKPVQVAPGAPGVNDPIIAAMSPGALRQAIERATTNKVTREAQIAAEQERRARLAEIAANKRAREADQAWNIVSNRLANGIPTAAGAPELRALSGTPYAAEYQRLAAEIPKRAAVAMLPIPQQQAELDALKAQRLKGTNKALDEEVDRREKILAGARKEYESDPLRAAAERGVLGGPVAPLDTRTLDALEQSLGARVQQADTVRGQMGRFVSPLLPEEASALGDMLNKLPPADRAARIGALASKMPEGMSRALAAQINAKDRGLALEFTAGASKTTSGRFTSEWIARGRQAVADKAIKEDNSVMIGLRARLAEQVDGVLYGPLRDDVIDAARLAYLGQQAGGLSPSPEGVMALVLGGPIVEHNGARIPVPAGVTDVPAAVSKAAASVATQAPGGFVYVGGKAIPVQQFVQALPGAVLESAGDGRYFVRAGAGLVLNERRRPIAITLTP